nr:hypothetical protein [uncultured Kingella sp.]
MIRRWLALTYYLYALRLAALSHFYFNRLYKLTCMKRYVCRADACCLHVIPRQPENLGAISAQLTKRRCVSQFLCFLAIPAVL